MRLLQRYEFFDWLNAFTPVSHREGISNRNHSAHIDTNAPEVEKSSNDLTSQGLNRIQTLPHAGNGTPDPQPRLPHRPIRKHLPTTQLHTFTIAHEHIGPPNTHDNLHLLQHITHNLSIDPKIVDALRSNG